MDSARDNSLARALSHPRYEVVALSGVEKELRFIPPGATVTVTCSATRGLEPTLQLAQQLRKMGFHAVPHIPARLLTGERELSALVDRLDAIDVHDIFAVGGDAANPAGPYASALQFVQALSRIPNSVASIGIAGYPEGHPSIDQHTLHQALLYKQPFAAYVVTQICFDPEAIVRWARTMRTQGMRLPVYVGLPGALDVARLLRISLKIGVGDSVRYISKQSGAATRLLSLRGYRPDDLVTALAPHFNDSALDIRGLHLNTFNQIERTERWRQEFLHRPLGGEPGHRAAV